MPHTLSTAVQTSIELVVKVHQLMIAGLGETPEANELRAISEQPWYAMTEQEQELVGGLSADLYTIGEPLRPATPEANHLANQFGQLIDQESWAEALEHLRTHEAQLPSDEVACLRGICWARLQQPAAAEPFFAEAIRQSPTREDFHAAYHRFRQDHAASSPELAEAPASVNLDFLKVVQNYTQTN